MSDVHVRGGCSRGIGGMCMCMVNSGFVVVRVWRHETIVDVVSVGSGVGRIIRVESHACNF